MDKSKIRYRFSRSARTYEDFDAVQRYVAENLFGGLLKEDGIKDGSLLDIGAGTGRMLQRIKVAFPGANLFGLDISEGMLEQALRRSVKSDRATEILDDIRSDWKLTLFTKARKLDPKVFVNFLRNEHPQTVALVLSVLNHAQAAEILGNLKEDVQVEVIMRMAELDKVSPDILVDLDRVLQDELLAVEGVEGQRLGGVEAVAEILNSVDRVVEATIMEGVEEQRENLADEIRKLMFVFEDLQGVDDRGIMAILKEVSTDDLKLALKTASEELKGKIFKSMSSRAVDMLKEDMEIMGPVRIKDVENAQQMIIKVAKRLEQEGKIQLMTGGGGEDEFV